MNKPPAPWFLFLAPLLLIGAGGCSKKSPTTTVTTVVQTKVIAAEFTRQGSGGSYADVSVFSDPAPNAVQCSARTVVAGGHYTLSRPMQKPAAVHWYDYTPFPYPATDCSLYVATNLGSSAGGGVSMPGSYSFLVPLEYDTLPWGDVRVSWTRSLYAAWYDLDLSCYAESANIYFGGMDTTLILSDTTVLVPLAFFRKYPRATSVRASISVVAHGGPMPIPGGSGNMVGDIKGVFYSSYYDYGGRYRNFFMGTPWPNRATTPAPQDSRGPGERRKQAILRAFGLAQPD